MKEVIKKIQSINWEKFWGRKTNVQITLSFIRGIGSNIFSKTYRVRLNHQLAYFNGKTTYGYAKKEEMEQFLKNIEKRFFQDLNFAKNFPAKNNKVVKLTVKKVQDLSKIAPRTNAKQLVKIYKKFLELENLFYFYGWSNFLWDRFLVNLVQKELEKVCNGTNQIMKYLEIFSLPSYPPPVVEEKLNLLSIADKKNKLSPMAINQLIKKHAQKFGWMAIYNFGEKPFAADYYKKGLKELLTEKINFKEEIRKIKSRFQENGLNFSKAMSSFKKHKKLFVLTNLLHQTPNMRDERERYRAKMVSYSTEIYRIISKKLKTPLGFVTNLTNQEIINGLKCGKVENLKEVKLRKNSYLIYFKNNKIEILPHHLIDSIIKKIEPREHKVNFLKGLIARRGRAKGRVKIILSGNDLHKIKQGDIFVTTMTKPNFVPVIKKCAAIVTDEGSILCHAAIVSREFKIPCIIGTKIATKVLKDGDLVGVDADKGIVKILKKK